MQEMLLEPPSSAVRSGCLRWPSDPWGGRRGRSGPPALLLRLAWGTLQQCMPTLHPFNHTSKLAGLFEGYLIPVKQHEILNFRDPENPWFSTISVLFFLCSHSGLQMAASKPGPQEVVTPPVMLYGACHQSGMEGVG